MARYARRIAVVALGAAVAGLSATPSHAEPDQKCVTVNNATLTGQFTGPLDTAGTLKGAGVLNGSTSFSGDALAPSAGLPDDLVPADTASYTGVLTLTSRHGVVTLRDVGIFDTDIAAGDGEFTSRARVIDGTGRFADSTGILFFWGDTHEDLTFTATVNGEVCSPA
jgi:hypothetical protein